MMSDTEHAWLWFWTVMIFASIGWYALLLVVIGYRGGRDVVDMTRALVKAARADERERDE